MSFAKGHKGDQFYLRNIPWKLFNIIMIYCDGMPCEGLDWKRIHKEIGNKAFKTFSYLCCQPSYRAILSCCPPSPLVTICLPYNIDYRLSNGCHVSHAHALYISFTSDNSNFATWQYSQKNNFVFVFSLCYLAPRSLDQRFFKSPILLLLQLPQPAIQRARPQLIRPSFL